MKCVDLCVCDTPHSVDSYWSWFVCVAALVAEGVYLSITYCSGIVLPVLMEEFKRSRQDVAWIGSLAIALAFGASPLAAGLCAKLGCRPISILGLLVSSVSLVAKSFSSSFSLLVVFGITYGLATSCIHVSNMLTISRSFEKRRALATGIVSAGPSLFVQGMGPLVGWLTSTFGWRSMYRIIASFFGVALVLTSVSFGSNIKDPSEEKVTQLHTTGKSAQMGQQTANVYGPDIAQRKTVDKNATLYHNPGGAARLFEEEILLEKAETSSVECSMEGLKNDAKFAENSFEDRLLEENEKFQLFHFSTEENKKINEQEVQYDELKLAVENDGSLAKGKWRSGISCDQNFSFIKRPAYICTVVSITLSGVGIYAPFFHLVKHCEEVGLSSSEASTLFIHIGISSLVGRILSGQIVDAFHISPLKIHQCADFICGGSMLLIWLASDYLSFSVFAVVYGLSNGAYVTTMYLALMNTVDARDRPMAFGLGEMLCSAGIVIGPVLAGLIADKTGSYVAAFGMTGGVTVFAAFVPLILLCRAQERDRAACHRVPITNLEGLIIVERETVL
ncbi:monocarboxylate transporter 5-like [Nematostella vectensis]|uniref:monocarboxylate transporter 5-like n=1 Tax=Nematostella vectensis TaxID=45351 RepID=UPI00138FE726|nr:monocarboxylate transporter 5-like [Nematostella vectensis]